MEMETALLASKQTSTEDVLAVAIQALRERGILNHDQFAAIGAEAILGACRWFDAQKGRVGQGVLVMELKAGGKPGWQPKPSSVVDQQREYGNRICDWLSESFPDLCDAKWGPHPASIAAVIRLHYAEGKGSLRKGEHGPVIRKAVRDFNKQYEIKESKA
ncbi:MAG: hypothetical protein NVS3B21_31650 [Acidimicrobiales bacterium]